MEEKIFATGDYVETCKKDKKYIGYITVKNDHEAEGKDANYRGERFSYDVLVERNNSNITTLKNAVAVADKMTLLAKANDLSARALKLALDSHDGQLDLAGNEYIFHIVQVGKFVKEVTNKDEVLAVAYLHDILEDTQVTEEDLKIIFSNEVVEAVKILTRKKYEPYSSYLERVKSDKLATIVKLADLKHNSDLTRISNPTERDYKRYEKYRKAITYLKGSD